MPMNYMRKKAALKKYGPLLKTETLDEIKETIAADKLRFSEDEITEIMEELMQTEVPGESPQETTVVTEEKKPAAAKSHAKPLARAGKLQAYYKHKVEPVNKTIVLKGRKEEILEGYKKKGECLQVTNIEERHAVILNQQTPNTLIYYFKEKEDDVVPAEKFF